MAAAALQRARLGPATPSARALADARGAAPTAAARLLALQRTIGNAAVARLVESGWPAPARVLARAGAEPADDHVGAPTRVTIDGPVGKRFHKHNVANKAADQGRIIGLLARIPEAQGGKRTAWAVAPLAGPDGECPKVVVDAIWDFQVFWKAKGAFRNIDAVVDPNKNTLKKLNELASSAPEPRPETKVKVDVIVRLEGAAAEAPIVRSEDIFPDKLLTGYQAKPDRRLIRLGMKTVKIRGDAAAMLQAQVEAIKSLFAADEPGEILLYGSSSGGRNIVDLAARLSREGMSIAYVASMDGAWYPDEALNSPGRVPGDSSVVPLFNPPGPVAAAEKHDFFQMVGNHTKLNRQGTRIFTSGMFGEEIHGNVLGFTRRDLSAQVRGYEPENDDRAHSWLTIIATPHVHARMQAILSAL